MVFVIVSAVFGAVWFNHEQERKEIRIEQAKLMLLMIFDQNQAPLAELMLDKNDQADVRSALDGFKVRGVLAVRLLNPDGRCVASTFENERDAVSIDKPFFHGSFSRGKLNGESVLIYSAPIRTVENFENIGHLVLYYDITSIESEIYLSFLYLLGFVGALFIPTVVSITMIVTRSIITPVRQITNCFAGSGRGRSERKTPVKGSPEIKALTAVLNGLSGRLAEDRISALVTAGSKSSLPQNPDAASGNGSLNAFADQTAISSRNENNPSTNSFKNKDEKVKPAGTKDRKRFKQFQVLLAEDSRIDQIVARELFKETGAGLQIADNGKQALEAVLQKKFDLVLMDCRMPIMNGYEAAEKIRESGYAAPIVGITAGAAVDDRQQCLAAGMNDFVKKPLDSAILMSIFEKWLKSETLAPVPEDKPDKNAPITESIGTTLEIKGIDAHSALKRIGGNRLLFIGLLGEFRREVEKTGRPLLSIHQPEQMSDQTASETLDAIHLMKGMAGNLSADELYKALIELESAIKNRNYSDWEGILKFYEIAFSEVIQSTATFLSGVSTDKSSSEQKPANHEKLDVDSIIPLLRELRIFVSKNNPRAVLCLEKMRKQLQTFIVIEDIERLAYRLNVFDFKAANVLLVEMCKQLSIYKEVFAQETDGENPPKPSSQPT